MKVIDQGITSASNIFNLLTDGDTRFDENTLNNMDDLMIFADSLPKRKSRRILDVCSEEKLET